MTRAISCHLSRQASRDSVSLKFSLVSLGVLQRAAQTDVCAGGRHSAPNLPPNHQNTTGAQGRKSEVGCRRVRVRVVAGTGSGIVVAGDGLGDGVVVVCGRGRCRW